MRLQYYPELSYPVHHHASFVQHRVAAFYSKVNKTALKHSRISHCEPLAWLEMRKIHFIRYSEGKCRHLCADSQECHQSIVRIIYCSGKHKRRCHHASSKTVRSFSRIHRQLPTCIEPSVCIQITRTPLVCTIAFTSAMQCRDIEYPYMSTYRLPPEPASKQR